MPKKPKKLVNLSIEAVAGVDKAANRRTFLVVKRDDGQREGFLSRLAKLFKADGAEPKTFEAALGETKVDDTWWQLNDALRTSLRSIVSSEVENKDDLIRTSVAQYAERIIAVAADAGKSTAEATVKMHDALAKLDEAPDVETLNELLGEVDAVAKAWREENKEGVEDMDLDVLLKGAADETKAAVKEAFAKSEATIAELRGQVDALSKKEDGKEDDINKADLPEPVRKRLEDLEKQAAEANAIAKAERESRVKAEIRKRAEGYAHAGKVDDMADAIYKAHEVSKEYGDALEQVLKTAHERIAEGNLFKEMGSGGDGGAVGDDPSAQFDAMVSKVAKSENLSYGEAARRVAMENPTLAAAYNNSVPTASN